MRPVEIKKTESFTEYNSIRSFIIENKEVKDLFVPVNLLKKYNVETDLKITWENVIDEVDGKYFSEIKNDISFILEQRKKLEWDIKNIPDAYVNEVRHCIDVMNQSRFNQSSFIGKGAAGIVFLQNERMDLCVKYLHDPSKSKNSIYKEFELLDRASLVEFKKIKIPKAHFLVNNRNPEKSIYSMDRIIGCNVEELIETPFIFLNMVDNDKKKILSIIENIEKNIDLYCEDIKLLHKNNIIHADLHIRNVLLSATGDIYLIDFGNSIDTINPANEYVSDSKLYESLENIKEQDIDSIKNIVGILLQKLKEIYDSNT